MSTTCKTAHRPFAIGSSRYCPHENLNRGIHTPPQSIFDIMIRASQFFAHPMEYLSDLYWDAINLQGKQADFEDIECGTLFYWVLRDYGTNMIDDEATLIDLRPCLSHVHCIFRVVKDLDGRVHFDRME